MKKEDYEKLGELEQVIYDHLQSAFVKNEYILNVEGRGYEPDGYINVTIIICGISLRCAVNKKGYICWFCGEPINWLIKEVPHLVLKLVAQTNRIVKEKEEEWRKERINQLKKELERLENK